MNIIDINYIFNNTNIFVHSNYVLVRYNIKFKQFNLSYEINTRRISYIDIVRHTLFTIMFILDSPYKYYYIHFND